MVAKILPAIRKSGCPMCEPSCAPSRLRAIRRKSFAFMKSSLPFRLPYPTGTRDEHRLVLPVYRMDDEASTFEGLPEGRSSSPLLPTAHPSLLHSLLDPPSNQCRFPKNCSPFSSAPCARSPCIS